MRKAISLSLIVAVLVLFIAATRTEAAVARVQAFSGTNTTFSSSVTTSSVTVTAGNLIICGAEADTVAQNGITMTDSKGNTWTRLQSTSQAGTADVEIWYAKAVTGGSGYTVTATDNGGGVDSIIICEEWSGQNLTAPRDVSTGAVGAGSTSLDSGNTAITSQANEIIVGVGAVSTAPSLTAGAGFSNLTTAATTFTNLGFETKVVSAVGAYNATMTAGSAVSWVMVVGTFRDADIGGGPDGFMVQTSGLSTLKSGLMTLN